MDATDYDLGETVDPADLPEWLDEASRADWQQRRGATDWQRRNGGFTSLGYDRLPRFLSFALGDPALTAWEEEFILQISRQDTGAPLTRRDWAILGGIAYRIGFR